jgi:prepilin signal peptidase PulO-like enzyme (type II secretory pathway)
VTSASTAVLVALLLVLGALTGAVIGSFAGVVRSRGWRGALRGRSHCLGCHRTLRWYELVPIASYAVQGGHCRLCHTEIGREALAVEMVGAAAGALVVLGLAGLVVLVAG